MRIAAPLKRTALVATMILMASGAVVQASSTNPLLDFESSSLTSAFRSGYSGVSGATVNVDVPYGLNDAQKYDVYLPASRSSAPIIVMIHGGNWQSGDKQDDSVAEDKAGYWVAKGYIFVSINYRLLPKSDPLIQAADIALGIASIQKNAPNWGGNASKIVLMGAGSGGHLAALLSSNPSLASDQGASPWAGAVVLETPALNIPSIMQSDHSNDYDTAFGTNVEFWEDASPTHLVASSGVPMLIVCSESSASNTCGRASSFKQAAQQQGVTVTVSQQSYGSSDINAKLGVSQTYSSTVDNFIESVL
jgi:acetyl esterase/lipase